MESRDAAAAEPPRLGALEAQVMDVLWDHGPCTVRDVIGHLGNDLAYPTIATVLSNLQRKALVTSQKVKRSTRYAARIGREEQVATISTRAPGPGRDRAASMLHFIENISDDDLELLRDRLRRRDDGNRP